MLQKNAVETRTFELLGKLMREPILADTRLVGGTALALQIGHRKSTDLDLFTNEVPDIDAIVKMLYDKYGFKPTILSDKTTIGTVKGIKVDVIYHAYIWLKPAVKENGVRLVSVEDIVAMKLHAIANSGKRPKDFVDIAFLSTKFSYNAMKKLALQKYPMYDPLVFDRAIIYFDDVQQDAVKNIKTIGYKMDWEKTKQRVVKMTDTPEYVFRNMPLQRTIQIKR